MGVYLGDPGPYGAQDLGLKLRLPKIRVPKVVSRVASAIARPVVNVATNLIPGGGIVRTAVSAVAPGIAKPRPKNAPPLPPATPTGSATVQVQRALSAATNRRTAARARTGRQAPSPAAVLPVAATASITPMEQNTTGATAVLRRETEKVKRGVSVARRITGGVAKLRDKQRQFSDTARRAATNAQTLQRRAELLEEAGVPGAATVAAQARQAASIAQEAARGADAAGAAVSAATTAGLAAGATGSESAGLTTAGLVGFAKEKPVVAAAVLAGVAFVGYRAFGPRRRSA